MIKKISMHDFTQATHAFSAQLILTNNNLCRIPSYKERPYYVFCTAKLFTKPSFRLCLLIKKYDFLIFRNLYQCLLVVLLILLSS